MPAAINRRQFLAVAAGGLAVPSRAADPVKGLVVGQPEGAAAGNAVLAAGGTPSMRSSRPLSSPAWSPCRSPASAGTAGT